MISFIFIHSGIGAILLNNAKNTPDPDNPLFEGLLRKGYLLKGEGAAEPFSREFRVFLSKKLG